MNVRPALARAHRQRWNRYALPALLLLTGASSRISVGAADAHAPATQQTYQLHPALDISLFAAEPDILDPVAMAFDEDGRVYVAEMRDYPVGIGPNHRPGGTIRLLEDRDGDGKIDRATVFAEELRFPTSVAPWKGGLLVTAPPEIIYLKDTNGDGKADVREVVLRGFTLGVTDSNVNGLRWGLDNRVHGLNGGNGGDITSTRKPRSPVPIRNLDFSFDPETGDFTTTYQTSGGFGLVFDPWGRSFVTYNIDHIQHRVLPVRYLDRFPGFPPVSVTVSISDHGEMARIYPISIPETRVNHPEQSGHFSSAGGMGFIGGADYTGDLAGSVLVCDVVGNLVHRDVLVENGPSFMAKRSLGEATSEFFASRDNAFRPVGVEPGPDGALYLIDMQRDVIEHPDYIPQRVKDKLDLRAGENRGRIYRITPKTGLPFRQPQLSSASAEELINALANPNGWWRSTAQRLLVERQDKTSVPLLKKMARNRAEPLGRLHALWTLQGVHALDEASVLEGLADPHPGVRENSLVLAEYLLPGSETLRKRILGLAADAAIRVRFQTALTLGNLTGPEANAALLQILLRDQEYRWSRLAVLSSLRAGADQVFGSVLADPDFRANVTPARIDLTGELAELIGARARVDDVKAISTVLNRLLEDRADDRYRLAVLAGLQNGLIRSGVSVRPDSGVISALTKISTEASPGLLAAAWKLARTLDLPENDSQRQALAEAIKTACDTTRSEAERLAAIRLLGLGKYDAVAGALFSLLEGAQPSAIQSAALEVLQPFSEPEVARSLVEHWRTLTPTMRPSVVNLLLDRRPFHEFLVAAIETEKIKVGELNLDLEQRRRLLRESSAEISARAAKFFGDEEYSNRKQIVEDWLKKLPASGDPRHGREVFEKICAQCHAAGGLGQSVGPNLSDVAHRSVEDLLSNILDPNMAINPSYIAFNVELSSGELETGVLQAESADAITLLQAQGKKIVVPRNKLKRLESSGISLMPEGLEATLMPADLRDLIAFLQGKK
jgi:putative membrane-bound dehydrogenase-like protein